jgi:threonine/homoserine/homoserine lactone efflux protein
VLSSSQIASYAIVSAVLIAIPGPSVLFAVGRALSRGRRSAMASVVGNAFGVYGVAVMVAVGLGAIVSRSDAALRAIKWCGAAYLVYLGVTAIRHRNRLSSIFDSDHSQTGVLRSARQGFAVGVANPKALLLFGAVLPQFVNRSAGHATIQMLLLALVSLITALVSDTAWVLLASAFRGWFARSPRRLGMVGGAGGLAIIAVGISVALTGRKD